MEEQLGFLGPKRLSEVEAAQDRVIQIVRELEEDEEIILDTGGSDATFSKSISFEVPSGFKVSYIGAPEVPVSTMESEVQQALDRGKNEATFIL